MKNLPAELYYRIQELSYEVRQDLIKKGVVAPVKNRDGSISIGRYKIVKSNVGYAIVDAQNEAVVERINLPQSAIVVANSLALGRYKDNETINEDKHYGYALFEEELHNKAVANSKRKTLEYFEVMSTKAAIAKNKKEYYKDALMNKYQKLVRRA